MIVNGINLGNLIWNKNIFGRGHFRFTRWFYGISLRENTCAMNIYTDSPATTLDTAFERLAQEKRKSPVVITPLAMGNVCDIDGLLNFLKGAKVNLPFPRLIRFEAGNLAGDFSEQLESIVRRLHEQGEPIIPRFFLDTSPENVSAFLEKKIETQNGSEVIKFDAIIVRCPVWASFYSILDWIAKFRKTGRKNPIIVECNVKSVGSVASLFGIGYSAIMPRSLPLSPIAVRKIINRCEGLLLDLTHREYVSDPQVG